MTLTIERDNAVEEDFIQRVLTAHDDGCAVLEEFLGTPYAQQLTAADLCNIFAEVDRKAGAPLIANARLRRDNSNNMLVGDITLGWHRLEKGFHQFSVSVGRTEKTYKSESFFRRYGPDLLRAMKKEPNEDKKTAILKDFLASDAAQKLMTVTDLRELFESHLWYASGGNYLLRLRSADGPCAAFSVGHVSVAALEYDAGGGGRVSVMSYNVRDRVAYSGKELGREVRENMRFHADNRSSSSVNTYVSAANAFIAAAAQPVLPNRQRNELEGIGLAYATLAWACQTFVNTAVEKLIVPPPP